MNRRRTVIALANLVAKHLPGKHDQKTHGRDTRDYVPEDLMDAAGKPSSWTDVVAASPEEFGLTPAKLERLLSKPTLDMSKMRTPFERHPDLSKSELSPEIPETSQIEFIGRRNGQTYYVNTEGYDYPRYIIRLRNTIVPDRG